MREPLAKTSQFMDLEQIRRLSTRDMSEVDRVIQERLRSDEVEGLSALVYAPPRSAYQ